MVRKLLASILLLAGASLAQTNIGPIIVTTTDFTGKASVTNPPAGKCREYFNSGTGLATFINSSGASCAPNGSGGGSGFGVNAANFPGADACLQIQAALYGSPAGSVINATSFTTITQCSVNPFQAPSQTSPVNFTGLPAGETIYFPGIPFPSNVPWFYPNKITVHGVGGYGVNKTVVQPSATFKTNRPSFSAFGGGTGLSSSGGLTVTISGTSFPSCTNLLGMGLFGSSNASSTAIPTPQNAQIGGVIIACTGTGPYTLTLGGAGAAGTVINTGWIIYPIIAGWQPNSQVFGSWLDQLTATCSTPASGNVTNCNPFIDTTSNEGAILSNFTFLNYDYIGLGVYTAQAQNWGPWFALTFNSSTTGNDNTIAIELGGTGWNANGGGVSGLCAVGNACALGGARGLNGVTITGSGTGAGDGGIGIDVNGANIQVLNPHYESLGIGTLIGNSAPAQNIKVSNATGCTNVSCALTSIVDISATYASGSAPAPTQNILIETAAREFAGTWDVRDFIHLMGIVADPSVGTYSIGSAGAAGQMVFHTAQKPSCITTGGAVDTNGAHCAPGIQMQIVSKAGGGRYYADSWNDNGTADVCQQGNNALQWAAQTAGITAGIILDMTGFNRNSGYPCATNLFAGTLGTTIPGGGEVEFAPAKFFQSVQIKVPAGYLLKGAGGNGLGASGGAAGTLFSPNIGNTANANYANYSVGAATVSTTAGSYAVTATGNPFTSQMVTNGAYLLSCATLPCTTQATMTGGQIAVFTDSNHVTLATPAQSTLAGTPLTITDPLILNAGIMRDIGVDGNSYGTGGGNGNGGFVGIYQAAGAGGGSYLENVSVGHVNALGIGASGINNLKLRNVSVTGNALASSVFACLMAPNGIGVDGLICQSGTSPNPTLSYGIFASGSGFKMSELTFQNVTTGVELAVNPGFSTNNVILQTVSSGGGSTGVTTLVDLGGVSSGGNGPNFQANLFGLQCPASGCTNAVNDHFNSFVLTDTVLGWYQLSKANAQGTRTLLTDSITSGVPPIKIGSFQLLPANKVLTSQVANVTTTTVATNGTLSSSWRVTGALDCLVTSAAATVTLTIGWTDTSNNAQTFTSSPATCTAIGASSYQSVSLTLNVKNATNITYATTITNTPTYDVRVTAEQMTVN